MLANTRRKCIPAGWGAASLLPRSWPTWLSPAPSVTGNSEHLYSLTTILLYMASPSRKRRRSPASKARDTRKQLRTRAEIAASKCDWSGMMLE